MTSYYLKLLNKNGMSFLKSFFKTESSNTTKSQIASFPWEALNEINQIDKLINESLKNKVVIFKHSTRCGISRAVLKNFEKQTQVKSDVKFYYLDLLNYREISNTLASRFEVIHQSPQVIVLKNGEVMAQGSHYEILNIAI